MAPKGGRGGSKSTGSSSGSSCSGSDVFSDWYEITNLVVFIVMELIFLTTYYMWIAKKKKTPSIKIPLGGFTYPLAVFLVIVGAVVGLVSLIVQACRTSGGGYSFDLYYDLSVACGALYTAGGILMLGIVMVPLTQRLCRKALWREKSIKTTRIVMWSIFGLLTIFWLVRLILVALHAADVTGSSTRVSSASARFAIVTTYDFICLAAAATTAGVLISALVRMKKTGVPKGLAFWLCLLLSWIIACSLINIIEDFGWLITRRPYTRNSSIVFIILEDIFFTLSFLALLFTAATLSWTQEDEEAAKNGHLSQQPYNADAAKPLHNHTHSSHPASMYSAPSHHQSWAYHSVPQQESGSMPQQPAEAPILSTPMQEMPASGLTQQARWVYSQLPHQQQQQSQQFGFYNQNTAYQPQTQPWQQNGYQAQQQHPELGGSPVHQHGMTVR